jgi:serine/threonine protein kinase
MASGEGEERPGGAGETPGSEGARSGMGAGDGAEGEADVTADMLAEDAETRERLPEESQSASGTPDLLAYESLKFGTEIGRGAYSRVYKGKYRGERVAIKKVHIPKGTSLEDKADLRSLRTEIALLKSLRHPNVLLYHGVALHSRNAYIVTELLSGGTLATLLFGHEDAEPSRRRAGASAAAGSSAGASTSAAEGGGGAGAAAGAAGEEALPWLERVYMARGAIHGLAYLHARHVVHRDVKTDNILVGDDWRMVFSDFGFARRQAQDKAMTLCGTVEYMSPEVLWGEEYDDRADVYSFGMVLVEIITRRRVGKHGFLERTPRQKFHLDLAAFNASLPTDCPPSFAECARQCLAYEAADRLKSDAVRDWLDDLWTEMCAEAHLDPSAPPSLRRPKQASASRAKDDDATA